MIIQRRLGDECNSVAYDCQARAGAGDPKAFVPGGGSDPRITSPLHRGMHLLSCMTAVRCQEQDWLVFKWFSDLREKSKRMCECDKSMRFCEKSKI